MAIYFMVFSLYLISGISCSDNDDSMSILEQPQSRFTRNGTNVVFQCRIQVLCSSVRQVRAYWEVGLGDRRPTSYRVRGESELRQDGFIFREIRDSSACVITLMAATTASVEKNNTHLQCVIHPLQLGQNLIILSDEATLQVFTDPPIYPNPSLQFQSATSLVLSWSPLFLWPNYAPPLYNVSIVNMSNGDTLLQASINSSMIYLATFKHNIGEEVAQTCSELNFTILPGLNETLSAYSLVGGYPIEPQFDASPINHTVYYHQDGTPGFVQFYIKLPSVCSYQKLRYTIIMQKLAHSNQTYIVGPKHHQGTTNVITENVKIDIGPGTGGNFSTMVLVDSTAGLSVSQWHNFTTYSQDNCRHDSNLSTVTTSTSTSTISTTSVHLGVQDITRNDSKISGTRSSNGSQTNIIYITVIGVLTLLLALVSLVLLVVCVSKRRMKGKQGAPTTTNTSLPPMVHNPIYDGPVYESIHQKFGTLPNLPEEHEVTAPNNDKKPPSTKVDSRFPRYVNEPIQPVRPRNNTISTDHQLDSSIPAPGIVTRSSSVSVPQTNLSCDRNKLQLTLSLDSKPTPSSSMAQDDQYTMMSPACAIGSILNGGWGETSPEDSSKYHE